MAVFIMKTKRFVTRFLILLLVLTTGLSVAAKGTKLYDLIENLEYAKVDEHHLLLDLYLPTNATNPTLVVWVHGGAWQRGSKSGMPLKALVNSGYAIASIDYRLSTVAPFPALIHDCKAAIRWLRAHQDKYKYDAQSVGIAGSSAGGHLVALIGTSNGNTELEGTVGKHLDQSSNVQAIVDFYGASNLQTILQQSTPHGLSVRVPALELLLGGSPEEQPELARLASPVFHVDPNDPPLLLFHGDQDPQMPINQAHELHGAYKAQKCNVSFHVIYGAAHGGKVFYDSERMALVLEFLGTHLAY